MRQCSAISPSECSDVREDILRKLHHPCLPRRASSTIAAGVLSGMLAARDRSHYPGLQPVFSPACLGWGRIHHRARAPKSHPSSHEGHRAYLPRGHCIGVCGRCVFGNTGRNMNWPIALSFAAGAVMAMSMTSRFADRFTGPGLQKGFAILAAAVAAGMLFKVITVVTGISG